MKNIIKIFLILTIIRNSEYLAAQTVITNSGTEITIGKTNVYIKGSYVNGIRKEAKVANSGNIYLTNDIINNSSNHLFDTKTGKVVFNGNANQIIRGNSSIHFNKFEVNNSQREVQLAQNILVRDSLILKAGNVNLNANLIDLDSTGYLYGENNNRRIYGNQGSIRLRRQIRETKLSENIGGLGIFISTRDFFSYTVIERGHARQKFAGDTSVLRYYNVYPSYPVKIDTLKMVYLEKESIPNAGFFKVFASLDDGVEWKNKGGFVDTVARTVLSTAVSPPDISKIRFSIFPTQNFATCSPNDPNYISAVFLVSSTAIAGDSVQMVNLSGKADSSYTWNFGDGTNSSESSPYHIYSIGNESDKKTYNITLTVSNGRCSDTRKKSIEVSPNKENLRQPGLFNGIEFVEIFPNPHAGNMNVLVKTTESADINIEIINSQGVSIDNQTERSAALNKIYDLNFLSAGMYYVKFRVGEDVRVVKMVKI